MSTHTHHQHEQAHDHPGGLSGAAAGFLNLQGHDQSGLAAESVFADNEAGMRTLWLALALLADTAHNIGDGLNSIPLLTEISSRVVARWFALRRGATRFAFWRPYAPFLY